MKGKSGFLIILALIILYVAVSYTALPYKGIINIIINENKKKIYKYQ